MNQKLHELAESTGVDLEALTWAYDLGAAEVGQRIGARLERCVAVADKRPDVVRRLIRAILGGLEGHTSAETATNLIYAKAVGNDRFWSPENVRREGEVSDAEEPQAE